MTDIDEVLEENRRLKAEIDLLRRITPAHGREWIPVPLDEMRPYDYALDEEGRCWFRFGDEDVWRRLHPVVALRAPWWRQCTHWLPHWSIPVIG